MFMTQTTHAALVNEIYSDAISSESHLNTWLSEDANTFEAALIVLPGYQLYVSAQQKSNSDISPGLNSASTAIKALQKDWVTALMQAFPDKRYWPDANSTMRVSYGKVEGYAPRDAVQYEYITYLDGVIEKYQPGDYEFDVHPKLIALHQKKDYGRYADTRNGKLPVCFIGSNQTTGGNSGSPAIDAYGNLVGVNFDRTWESTMSDYYYDVEICRNIMVDIRYILFVSDKFAGAGHLVDEMEIVGGE
jgi:hypothetical protein